VVFPACYAPGKRDGKVSCAFSSQCRSGACATDGKQCGTCVTGDSPAGSECQSWTTCAFGLHCTSTGTCAANGTPTYAAEGEACDLDATPLRGCVGDLYCKLQVGTRSGTCVAPPGAGKPCADNQMSFGLSSRQICAAGTTCVQGTCRPPGGCSADLTCDSSSYCVDNGTGTPVCSPRAKLGQACMNGSNGLPCLAPATCAEAAKCIVPRADGEACDTDNPCDMYLLCVGGKCQKMSSATCPA
jgi:hypothetical protein